MARARTSGAGFRIPLKLFGASEHPGTIARMDNADASHRLRDATGPPCPFSPSRRIPASNYRTRDDTEGRAIGQRDMTTPAGAWIFHRFARVRDILQAHQ